MFVVTVDFQIQPALFDTFMVNMLANARASLELEENCLQFDVCIDNADPHRIFLFEVYLQAKDFDAHLKMPHFLEFNAQCASQVIHKNVRTFERSAGH